MNFNRECANLADPRAFARAYREHRPRAVAAARAVLGSTDAAEDVVQEVFASLWRRPEAFDPERSSFDVYVTLLARSRALDHWRAASSRAAAHDRFEAQQGRLAAVGSDEQAAERELVGRTLDAIARTPTEQRTAIVLATVHGLTGREIAAHTNVPLGTARSRLRLGLAKVRAA